MRKAIMVILAALVLVSGAIAEETTTLYVLCDPSSEINIRVRATSDSELSGRLFAGDAVEVDQAGGRWSHLTDILTEAGEGWVRSCYLVDGAVEVRTFAAVIDADGRVAARKTPGGDRRGWVAPGDAVTVYAVGGGWAVTDKGYIAADYLKEGENQ